MFFVSHVVNREILGLLGLIALNSADLLVPAIWVANMQFIALIWDLWLVPSESFKRQMSDCCRTKPCDDRCPNQRSKKTVTTRRAMIRTAKPRPSLNHRIKPRNHPSGSLEQDNYSMSCSGSSC